LTERSWRDYLVKVERQNLSVDLNNDQIMDLTQVTPTLNEAIQTNRVVQHIIGGASLVAIPIAVRGLVIGAFEFELDGEQALDTEDLEMMQTVSERLGLALESSRLFEENRRTAQREAVVNEIGSRITASNSVNSVLNEAARSIQNTLGANRVAIRLGTPPGNGHDRDRRPS
jgi:GAF domain-containing protein